MDRLLIRLVVIITFVYFLAVYISAWFCIEWFDDSYILLYEYCVCTVMSSQGKYHCRYMRFTAYGVAVADTITRTDNAYNYLAVDVAILLPISLMVLSLFASFVLALRHYYKVKQLKRKKYEFQRRRTK